MVVITAGQPGWVAHVEGATPGATIKAESLVVVARRAQDRYGVDARFIIRTGDPELDDLLLSIRSMRQVVAALNAQVKERVYRALSHPAIPAAHRDAAVALGMSHQRVHQLRTGKT